MILKKRYSGITVPVLTPVLADEMPDESIAIANNSGFDSDGTMYAYREMVRVKSIVLKDVFEEVFL